jgi:hypothetical protein
LILKGCESAGARIWRLNTAIFRDLLSRMHCEDLSGVFPVHTDTQPLGFNRLSSKNIAWPQTLSAEVREGRLAASEDT